MENEESNAVKLTLNNIVLSGVDGKPLAELSDQWPAAYRLMQ